MTIETVLKAHTEALNRYCDLLEQGATPTAIEPNPAPEPTPAKAEIAATETAPSTATATAPVEAVTLTYEGDIKPAVVEKMKNHKQDLIALLGEYGVKNFAEIDAGQYPELLDRVNAL